jgi:hypothetical protein
VFVGACARACMCVRASARACACVRLSFRRVCAGAHIYVPANIICAGLHGGAKQVMGATCRLPLTRNSTGVGKNLAPSLPLASSFPRSLVPSLSPSLLPPCPFSTSYPASPTPISNPTLSLQSILSNAARLSLLHFRLLYCNEEALVCRLLLTQRRAEVRNLGQIPRPSDSSLLSSAYITQCLSLARGDH